MDPSNQPALHGRVADAMTRLRTLARSHETNAAFAETLSPLQARALVMLDRRGDQRIGEIARELLVTFGTVSVALTVLEERGYVKKFTDPDEHRAVRVKLTRRGRTAANRAATWTADVLESAVSSLAKGESESLLATMLKLLLALEINGAIGPAHMCLSCRHFEIGVGKRPHHCSKLDLKLKNADLRVECPVHERAGARRLAEVSRKFRPLA